MVGHRTETIDVQLNQLKEKDFTFCQRIGNAQKINTQLIEHITKYQKYAHHTLQTLADSTGDTVQKWCQRCSKWHDRHTTLLISFLSVLKLHHIITE